MIDHCEDLLDTVPTTLDELQDMPFFTHMFPMCEVFDIED